MSVCVAVAEAVREPVGVRPCDRVSELLGVGLCVPVERTEAVPVWLPEPVGVAVPLGVSEGVPEPVWVGVPVTVGLCVPVPEAA